MADQKSSDDPSEYLINEITSFCTDQLDIHPYFRWMVGIAFARYSNVNFPVLQAFLVHRHCHRIGRHEAKIVTGWITANSHYRPHAWVTLGDQIIDPGFIALALESWDLVQGKIEYSQENPIGKLSKKTMAIAKSLTYISAPPAAGMEIRWVTLITTVDSRSSVTFRIHYVVTKNLEVLPVNIENQRNGFRRQIIKLTKAAGDRITRNQGKFSMQSLLNYSHISV